MSEKTKVAFGVEPSTRLYRLRLSRYQALAEAIAQFVRSRPDGQRVRLLDVGSGNGRTMRYLEAEGVADRIDFIGLELSERRIAGMYGRERWRIVRANAEQGLPLADACVDCAVCEQVLEHLHVPEKVLGEIARVLRPGGLLVAGVPSFPPLLYQVRRHVVPAMDKVFNHYRDHHQVFSVSRFDRMVRQTGRLVPREVRGFRVVSGGLFAPLEDRRWFWRLNRALGRRVPSVCAEIQVLAERT
jgi:SAM-dependent methyltransferase